MIAFTILGVLFFWMFCWQIGYYAAMACDAKAKWDDLTKPVINEMEALILALSAVGSSPVPEKEGKE